MNSISTRSLIKVSLSFNGKQWLCANFYTICFMWTIWNRTWIQELQLHDSFSLMEKSRSSNIQEMKFALAQKSSDSFCNTLKLNDNTYAGFQIYKNVPLPESTLTWGENWRRWKNAGGKIPWIQNARYLSCIFQSCKMLEHLKHSTYKSSKHAPPTCTG